MIAKSFYTLLASASFLLIAACSSSGPQETATPTITPTPFPTFAVSRPTEAPQVATAAAAAAAASATAAAADQIILDPERVERGRDRYTVLECAACHGDTGEGTDDGPSLIGYSAPEAEFIDFMRTGGAMGLDHRFPTERLSNNGIGNLYQYVISLSSE